MKYKFILLFLVITTSPLYAYIDPGTGGLIVSTIIGITAALVFSVKGYFYNLLAKISGEFIKGSNDFTGKLVLFSEGKNYWQVFKPLIDELILQEKAFVYLTVREDDPCLETDSCFMRKQFLKNMNQAMVFLNSMKADVCVMTTPQLNVLTLKRSKHVKHYCHIFHAPADIHTYKKFAFDYYDSALCVNNYQIENITQLDRDRNNRKKLLFETGCTYYDLKEVSYNKEADSVLVAPTWGDKSFLPVCGEAIIDRLLEENNKVIFRPHPQSWTNDRELIEKIISKYSINKLFHVDKSENNREAIFAAKIMICNISGIIYDFIFLKRRPVIVIDMNWKNGGYEDSDIVRRNSAYDLAEEFGKLVKAEDVDHIGKIVNETGKLEITDEIINRHVFNFGNAGKTAAKQIISLCNTGE